MVEQKISSQEISSSRLDIAFCLLLNITTHTEADTAWFINKRGGVRARVGCENSQIKTRLWLTYPIKRVRKQEGGK